MQSEKGYVLILTMVIICMITISTAILVQRTLNASFIVMRRPDSVRAYQLAESAALEGFWRLSRDPAFRTAGSGMSKTLSDPTTGFSGSYTFQIIDSTPATLNDDLQLQVLGTGVSGRSRRVLRLYLTRATVNSNYEKALWQEENN